MRTVCVYIYICTHLSQKNVKVWIGERPTCRHRYLHAYIHTYIHTFIHSYIQTCRHRYLHAHIHTYMHACMHTYIHTCKHACVHIYLFICLLSWPFAGLGFKSQPQHNCHLSHLSLPTTDPSPAQSSTLERGSGGVRKTEAPSVRRHAAALRLPQHRAVSTGWHRRPHPPARGLGKAVEESSRI